MKNDFEERATTAFREYLGHNHLPDGSIASYEVAVSGIADAIAVRIVFKSGDCYCCTELNCHLHLIGRWDRLRSTMLAHGLQPPDQMRVHVTGVIEEGVLIRPDKKGNVIYTHAYSIGEDYVEDPG